jgi:hypothetical protein
LEGGLTDAASFPISHHRSIGKGLTCDWLASRRSTREDADPQLIPGSVELATGFLFSSPQWPARGGKQCSGAQRIQKQQKRILLTEIPEVEELTFFGHRSTTRQDHHTRMHQI